ncbi:hypothetical protein AB5J55_03540 [Streptomyces sp. R11]|uniref:Uncharacterized protein n=1 Tax=Streptomyces sp. R11 TaxID=3238625 RepID=A0AB39MS50_9ACTN
MRGSASTTDPHGTWYALLAVGVPICAHLAFGRRTILSAGAGTAVQVAPQPDTCA